MKEVTKKCKNGFKLGEMIVISAQSNVGKSVISDQYIVKTEEEVKNEI